ncbi:MAG: flagellar biosynthesis protein FliQ [Actinomycetota bacterium]|nr:flagellar biosynthesis protein FliQ [Actinomycetota bacterium]
MTQAQILQIAAGAMMTGAKIAAPIVLGAMVIGLVVSLFQSVTQIQEQTLTFVPKLVVVGLIIAIAGHWMLGQFASYTDSLFATVPQLLANG